MRHQKLLAPALLSAGFLPAALANEQPNFLIIVCEDIGPYLNCFGDTVAHSPNLDKFAEDAIRHKRMFTTVGVSSPSRYALITGRYPSADGANYMRSNYFDKKFEVVPPPGVKCYTEHMRKAGYYCTNNAKTDFQFTNTRSVWDEQGNQAHWRNAPAEQPFLSVFNLNVTHESFIWKNTDSPLLVSPDSVRVAPYHPDNAVVRHDYAVLYSNIAKMDRQFQTLLAELDKSDRAKNTIVLFYSDNGGPLPRAKREIMDSGTMVPFMIRFPDRRDAGSVTERMNMFVDIPATILSLADIRPPHYMHGKAMYGRYEDPVRRAFVYGATDRFDEQIEKRGSIRSERYLYIRNYLPEQSVYRPVGFRQSMPMMRNMLELKENRELDSIPMLWFAETQAAEQLFDCETDPHQIHNLAGDPEFADILGMMRDNYRGQWIDAYQADWEKHPESYFVEKMWPNGVKPHAEDPVIVLDGGKAFLQNDMAVYSAVYQVNGKGINGKASHWNLYADGVILQKGDRLSIRLERIGFVPSDILNITY